jgi:hypothetical protein
MGTVMTTLSVPGRHCLPPKGNLKVVLQGLNLNQSVLPVLTLNVGILNEALQEVARERDEQSFFIASEPSLQATRSKLASDASSSKRMYAGGCIEKRMLTVCFEDGYSASNPSG